MHFRNHAARFACPLFCALIILLFVEAVAAEPDDKAGIKEPINFSRDVMPILSDYCFQCHGPDEKARKGKLRLDTHEGAFRKKELIVPGKSAESELIKRLISIDEEEVMPPPASKRKLSAKQIDTIKRWIEQGAGWGKHWAYEAPQKPAVPAVRSKNWPKNPIDQFVLARLEKEKLNPAPEAAKETLIRRVTLDLTGLPPTPEEVDAFLADASPEAYEKLVDRLLTSPRYGERMVWDWLDAARYADTNGYQGDQERSMWPWRDWAIRAHNENIPYDRFTVEQLAGDLLPNATREQILATAFNRNHMINGEGGRIAAENRVDYVIDQTETMATIWLGVTMTCARCHDHKYDPFTQKDYYSLFAFFNNTPVDGGGGSGQTTPVLSFATPEQEKKIAEMKAKEEAIRVERDQLEKTVRAAQDDWERALVGDTGGKPGEVKWVALTPGEMFSDGGATLTKTDENAVLVSGVSPAKDSFVVTINTNLQGITAFKLEALPDPSFINKGPGRADNGNFVLTEFKLQGSGKPVDLGFVSADFEQPSWLAVSAVDGKSETGWAIMPEFGKSHSVIFEAKNQVGYGGGETLLSFRLEFLSNNVQHVLGKFKLYATTDNRALLRPMPEKIRRILDIAAAKRDDAQKKELTELYLGTHPGLAAFKQKREDAKKAREQAEKNPPQTMVMKEKDKPRDSFVLVRGAYDKPTDKVPIAVPASLPPMPADAPKNRLGLAKWLTDPAHPLTARVTVNRFWQMFFGIGLVKTAEDFGVQGEKPSHPELLDWLATEFVRSGWDVKAMHKLILTSATYRQSSKTTAELTERDPENRLLARGARYRLPSWMMRDQALAVSGLLFEKIGGPPIKPYQPSGIWEEATFGTISYKQDHGESLYRRSLYIFWRRIVGPTMFFDNAARQICTVKPYLTNTPLHALTTLNDITYVEAARALAQRVIENGGAARESRIDLAFRLATSRKPNSAEREILLNRLDILQKHYAADKAAAQSLLKVGESKRNEKIDAAEHAAYTGLCSLIMNLDEAITKE